MLRIFALLLLLCQPAVPAYPADLALTPELHARVEKYKVLLNYWAKQPLIVAAAKQANLHPKFLTNASWGMLADNDPFVIKLGTNPAAEQLARWKVAHLAKLHLRDRQGNVVAYAANAGRPLLYNSGARLPFINGLQGAWSADEIKPDPSSQQNAIQISAPVVDGNKIIGVLQSAVLAD